MKYIVIVGDGMADYTIDELGGKTPLQVANKPNMDHLAKGGILGMAKTVPDGMKPGSDVANLAAMGYNPLDCYTGRSPLEAVSMGIHLGDSDIAFRCNLVTLSGEENYDDKTMLDYSSDEITSKEANQLIETINNELETQSIRFYSGMSYRHCMVWKEGPKDLNLTPPHDISNKKIKSFLPRNQEIYSFMKKSHEILHNHCINMERVKNGLNPANSIWLWGEGTRPVVFNFYDRYGIRGSVISAVDLIKGIGICAGLHIVEVEGATGNIYTNFKGKGEAALNELIKGQDFVYIHVEAPDECGHRGELDYKIKAIELIDEHIVGPVTKGLETRGEEYSILIMPDHPTPISIRTHVSDPIPFLIYRSNAVLNSGIESYYEETAKSTGIYIENGYQLIGKLVKNEYGIF